MANDPYVYAPHEKPFLPGGPHTPRHSPVRRWGYVAAALISGTAASLGNALVSVNSGALAGAYGVDVADAGWLLAAYVSMAVCANLLLVRARQQFGITPVTQALLLTYIAAVILQFVMPGFATALLVRAICGLTTAGLIGLTIYNMLQVFPPQNRPMGLVLAFGIPQLGVPLARLIPVEILTIGGGHGLSYIELGLGLIAFAAATLHPVPPTVKSAAFQSLDFVTMTLFVPAIVLLCSVMAEGRVLWWADTPWLGWALMLAIPLLVAAIWLEGQRARPLLVVRWVTTGDVIRFGVVALLIRFALAEQTFGAVGLLSAGGLNNDQLHVLFTCVLVAMICGSVASAFMLKPGRMPVAILAATLFILVGSLLDSTASNLTRPTQLFVSQSLIGLGAALFIGPAMIFGFQRMVKHGPEAFITFVVLFGMTQNLGSLLGAAVLGSYQTVQARSHWLDLGSHLLASDPLVAARTNLGPVLTRESNIASFNDVFRLVAGLAGLIALFMIYRIFQYRRQVRLQEVRQ